MEIPHRHAGKSRSIALFFMPQFLVLQMKQIRSHPLSAHSNKVVFLIGMQRALKCGKPRRCGFSMIWRVVMRCELCSSGKRVPRRKLCENCAEAITRLWAIVHNMGGVINSMGAPTSEVYFGSTPAAVTPTGAKV
jgi:hypothetical protein